MRGRLLLFTVLAIALMGGMAWFAERMLQGVESPATPNQVRAADHVLTGVAPDPGNLNPFTTTSQVAWRYVLDWTHDPLMDQDPATGELRPCLARAVETHGLELRFHFHEAGRSDPGRAFPFGGRPPLASEDVLFTWEIAKQLRGQLGIMADGLDLVEDARIEDPSDDDGNGFDLVVRLKAPAPYALRRVATSWLVVHKQSFLSALPPGPEGVPADDALAARVLAMKRGGRGTGPYKLATLPDDGGPWWRPGRDLKLESWVDSSEGGSGDADDQGRIEGDSRANFRGLHLLFDPGEQQVLQKLREGELDWHAAPDLPGLLAQEPEIQKAYRLVAFDSPQLGTHGVIWNTQRSAVADPRVRRALGMLFDRDGIVGSLMNGLGTPAATLFKPGVVGHVPELAPLPFDPAGARALLLEAGVELPLEVTIAAPAELPLFRQILDLAADGAQAAGVRLKADIRTFPAIMELYGKGACDGILLYMAGPVDVPYGWFHSGEVGNNNMSRIVDGELDRLLDLCNRTADPMANAEPFQQLARRIDALQPVAFLFHPMGDTLIHNRIQGVEPGPLGLNRDLWYVAKPKR